MTDTTLGSLLGAVIEAMGRGVVVFDRDGRVAFASQSARSVVAELPDAAGTELLGRLLALGGRRVPLKLGDTDLGQAVFLEPTGDGTLAGRERQAILQTLQLTDGRLADAARQLGISRTTLWRRLKEYGVTRES